MVVRHAREIGCGPMVIHHRDQFVDQLTRLRADDLRTKEFAYQRRTEEFHEAVCGAEQRAFP